MPDFDGLLIQDSCDISDSLNEAIQELVAKHKDDNGFHLIIEVAREFERRITREAAIEGLTATAEFHFVLPETVGITISALWVSATGEPQVETSRITNIPVSYQEAMAWILWVYFDEEGIAYAAH